MLDCFDNFFLTVLTIQIKLCIVLKTCQSAEILLIKWILTINFNIENQLINYLNKIKLYSICIDENTDITSSEYLSIISRFCNIDEVSEELIIIISIPAKTTGKNICEVVINMLENIGLELSKIVSVTTDSAPSMVGKHRGFVITKYTPDIKTLSTKKQ